MDNDLVIKKTISEQHEQQDKPTIKSLGGTTPHGLKSILSPKIKFQDRARQDYNFKEMADSASNFAKTLDVGSPKNFRIKSRASIIKENSNAALNASWHSKHDSENFEERKSQSHHAYNLTTKKEKIHPESSEKMQTKSDRMMIPTLPKPPDSIKSIKSLRDSKKSFSVPHSKNPSSTKDPSVDSNGSQLAIGGVEGFVRIVMPADINNKIEDIADSMTDLVVSKFIDKLSKALLDYHPAASTLKQQISGRKVQVEERGMKDFVPWSDILVAYRDPKRKVRLITSDKYC